MRPASVGRPASLAVQAARRRGAARSWARAWSGLRWCLCHNPFVALAAVRKCLERLAVPTGLARPMLINDLRGGGKLMRPTPSQEIPRGSFPPNDTRRNGMEMVEIEQWRLQ